MKQYLKGYLYHIGFAWIYVNIIAIYYAFQNTYEGVWGFFAWNLIGFPFVCIAYFPFHYIDRKMLEESK